MDQIKKTLLIIDDEEAILFALKDALSEAWLSIDTAPSLDDAREHLLKRTYDGAVIDLRLGGSNDLEGFEAIHMVRERNPDCKIILLTAYAFPGIKDRVLAEGADYFMEKPASPEDIRNIFLSSGAW